jgi:hypothetical protein
MKILAMQLLRLFTMACVSIGPICMQCDSLHVDGIVTRPRVTQGNRVKYIMFAMYRAECEFTFPILL